MGLIYVAKEAATQQNDVTEDAATYPPGVEEAPEFGTFIASGYQYLTADYSDAETIHDALNLVSINTLYFHTDGSFGIAWPNQFAVPPIFYDGTRLVCVDPYGYLDGEPWQDYYYYIPDGSTEASTSTAKYWFKEVYTSGSEKTVYVYPPGYTSWQDADTYFAGLGQTFVSTVYVAETVNDVQDAAVYAMANGYAGIANANGSGIAWPLTDFGFTDGFIGVSRLGFFIKSPANYDALEIVYTVDNTSRHTFRYSNALPDTWGDVLSCDRITGVSANAEGTQYVYAIPTELLTGTDPLYLWMLQQADDEKDFITTKTGQAFDISIRYTQDGTTTTVNLETLYSNWPITRQTKLKILDSSPTQFRIMDIEE